MARLHYVIVPLLSMLCTVYGQGMQLDLLMPEVQPDQRETYLCRTVSVNNIPEGNIIRFVPRASRRTVHHMVLYGCSSPAFTNEVWNCGAMESNTIVNKYPVGQICNGPFTILYSWAMDAPEFALPEGVGFRVGGRTDIQHLVLQVHYLHPLTSPDSSGMTVTITPENLPKRAGVILLLSMTGYVRAHSIEKFETNCIINDNAELHPFAFRVHTHKLGKVVSGYVVRQREWFLIGKRNPQEAQMFYSVADSNLVIKQGDIVAARCTMDNLLDEDVSIGATSDHEMCNFYVMYWVDGDVNLNRQCNAMGPPQYYWTNDAFLRNTNIPDADASTLP